MQSRSCVDVIPREILVRALHSCDCITIIRFSLTCKKAHDVVSSSVSLQLHIELEINGLEMDGGSPKSNLSYSSTLRELKEYREGEYIRLNLFKRAYISPLAWLNFRLGPLVQQLTGIPDDAPNWGLRNGFYYGEFRVSELDHDEDFLVDRTQVTKLGSSTILPPTNYEKKFNSCTMDPKQDLAVLVEDEQPGSEFARFHFRSIATGQSHPLAECPILTVTFDHAFLRSNLLLDEPMSTDLKIMQNYLAVKVHWPESGYQFSEILVWDWKNGTLLARICSDRNSARYTFLDGSHLLMYSVLPANPSQSIRLALLVYRIPTVAAEHGVPLNAVYRSSLYPSLSPILIFEFPELHPSWEVTGQHFMLAADPLPGDLVYDKSATLLCSHVTTLSLEFRIWNNPSGQPYVYGSRKGTPTDFRVFVDTHYLFKRILEHPSEGTTILPWAQWGVAATRWFIEDDPMEYLALGIYRSQYPRYTRIKSTETQLLSIVDFNSPVIMRYAYNSSTSSRAKRASADKAEKTAVLAGRGLTSGRPFQTSISSPKLGIPTVGKALNQDIFTETIGSDMKTIIRVGFKEPVISCLPYRVTTKVQRMPLQGQWRIHGEYLVGVPRLNWDTTMRAPLSLFKLEFPSHDENR